ncbi:hypothetical protein TD95_004919 [Thielaviopsis punctulata]|uniref:t-SNARE coiled-coil homology domain-containing protein n=1 Tax=Thielaviopsis punctulata TaxID=72032 RepID=A0A0F4ZCN1_9PEZI|nr:hypothetical protein TD95_004919 [Thielaviopsis punctulata]
MSNLNHTFILADHIKLALLERQRASSALAASAAAAGGAPAGDEVDAQDGHIAQSLEQLAHGVAALRDDEQRLRASGRADEADEIADALPALAKHLDTLTSQFHRFTAPSPAASPAPSPAPVSAPAVRFRDSSPQLFSDYPPADDDDGTAGYRDAVADMDNVQMLAYHDRVLEEQDDHLDRLGESISRQRELSMRIGDELDAHIDLLDDTEGLVDRHQSRLDRARRSLGRIAEGEENSRGMMTIVILIIILLLLIAVFK